MSSGKVSSAFKNAIGRMPGVEEAKQAEANLNSIPMPDGWKGRVLVTDMYMDVSKGKGNPYVNMEVTVVEDDQYKGKTATRNWTFNETTNAQGVKTSAAEKFEWFLNACEFMGLPREIRTGYEDEGEIIGWFMDPENPRYLEAEVKVNKGFTNLNLRKLPEALDHTESIAPPEPAKPSPQESSGGQKEVSYGEAKWILLEELADGTVRIKSKSTGKERVVKKTDLD